MGNVDTGSTKTQSNSPAVRGAVDTIASRLGTMANQPNGTTYVAPSTATTSSWQQALQAANNPGFANNLGEALGSFGNRAAGNEIGMNDPGFATIRNKVADDTMSRVNTAFNNSGLFGSDSNMKAASEGLANALGELDYAQFSDSLNRQSQAADKLGSLFSTAQLPASVTGAVGAAQDADAQARQTGGLDWLTRLTGALGGTASAAGTTTKDQSPLWKVLLGTAATAAGMQ